MKEVIIKYTFNDDDLSFVKQEASLALKAQDLGLVVHHFRQALRQVCKYSDNVISVDHAEKWSEVFNEILEENGISDTDLPL